MEDTVKVGRGIPERYRHDAAATYVEAFRGKLQRLSGTSAQVVHTMALQMDPDMAVAAYSDRKLLGIAGFYHAGRNFGMPRFEVCVRKLGLIRGALLYLNLRLFLRRGVAGELVMDGIAVSAEARGQGIGTRLLDAIFEVARNHGYRYVSLGVADTNPAAFRLYQRSGFVAQRTVRYPLTRWLFGFSAVTYMRKAVGSLPTEPRHGNGS